MITAVAPARRRGVLSLATRQRVDHGLWLALALGVCASGPVIAATIHGLIDGWLPAGDQANIATRAYDVLTSHSSLVGLHSDASAAINQPVYSLGPMLFWLLALPARLGSPGWMTLTMGLVNTGAIIGVVVLARRRGGRALMFIAAVAIVLMSRSLAPEVLHDMWNPSAGLFPFTLLIFLCWSLACGEYRLLPLAVLVVSFVVQCQLAFVPPCLAIMAIGLAGLALSLRGSETRALHPRGGRTVWQWAIAALVVGVVCWTPPLIDQIQGKPGNLTNVVKAATTSTPKLGAGVGWHAVVRAVGVPPWWLRNPASPWNRKFEVRASSSAVATVSTVLILMALVGVAAIGVLRRRAELWAGGLIALALCAGLFAVAEATPTKRVLAETLGYTLWWGSPAGMFVWTMLAWSCVRLLSELAPARTRAPSVASTAGVVAVAAAAAAAVSLAERPDYHLPEYRPLAKLYAGLQEGVPARRTVLLVGYLGNRTFRFKMAARFAMVRRGIRPLSPGIDVRLGSFYELDHHRYDCAVYVQDRSRSPARQAAEVARFSFEDGTGSYPVTVWVSPAGCPRSRALARAAPSSNRWASSGTPTL
ncbi:MAG TPA: hypothetical protein VNZ01_06130 [Solirubrobacteraceae bacterium]|nr:hypothetical protein [Solirubrobacteraceae bacterium]